ADLLDRIELIAVTEAFDGQDRLLGRLMGKHVTGIVRHTIDHDSAYAAGRAVAASHRASEADLFRDYFPKCRARLMLDGMRCAIEFEDRRERGDRSRQRRCGAGAGR